MRLPDRETVAQIRAEYPPGTKVELLEMADEYAPPTGTIGEVVAVDDAGDLVMRWQNGSSLKIILEVDRIRKVDRNDK